jgi:putative membrane protein
MRVATLGFALAAFAAAPLSAQAPTERPPVAPPALDDAAIFALLEKANTAEIELGELAARMGSSAEVKDLGKNFAAAHTQARQKARDLAKKVNITPALPADPMKDVKDTAMAKYPEKDKAMDHTAAMTRLKGLKGAEFDQAFVAQEIAHHTKMIEAVDTKFLPTVKNAELKQLLTELKPSLQSHLDQARALEKRLALGN